MVGDEVGAGAWVEAVTVELGAVTPRFDRPGGLAEFLPLAGSAVAGVLVLGSLVGSFVGAAAWTGVSVESAAVETGPLGTHG